MRSSLKKLLQNKILFILLLLNFFIINFTKAQTAVTSATTTYLSSLRDTTYIATGATGSGSAGNTYTYNYSSFAGTSSNNEQISSLVAGAVTYDFLPISNMFVKMRRVDNAVVTGSRNLKFTEGTVTGSVINMNEGYDDNMESFFIGNQNFNSGTDNLFGNQGDGNGNNNDIERVDVIFPSSIIATDNSKVGFGIFERGTTAAHDPVKVAVILSLDGSGKPSSYSSIITISSATYGGTDVLAPRDYIIMRKDTASEPMKMSTTTNQAIGGVFFKYSDFGIANNTAIYGYSVIPDDFPVGGTPANLVDYTNATYFPTNTSSTTGSGGIDLVAFTGISQSSPVVYLPVSGNVYDDENGLQDAKVNGTGTNAGGTLYAQLVNSSNVVISTVAVNSDGTYAFPAAPPGTYKVVLNTSATANAIASLPAGYVNTGEYLGTGTGSDGTPNGIITSVVIDTAYVTDANFGIDQIPTANKITATSQANPGGTNKVTVPTLTGSDPEQGAFPGTGNVDTVIIKTLPVNGTLYYNNIAISAGDTIKNYNPSLLTVDPNTGSVAITFTFSEVDAALKSSSPDTVSMPFNTLIISGSVFDDANGLSDNTVNGTGTNAGGLNAVLVDAGTGKVIAAAAVAANGSFSLPGADAGNYNVEITTATATVGATAPAVTLPAGWVSTGEHFGTGSGSDGTVNGILPLGNVSSDTANSNFGIDQLPAAATTSGTFVNPGGTATIQVPTLTGSDPEQGAFPGTGNVDTVIINTLPASGILYYNGTPVVAGDTIKNYNPALLTFDPVNGSGSYTITFSEVDAAGNSSSPATVTINITSIAISGSVFDDANGLSDNTVNGTGTNAGGLNAVLVDAGTGKVIAAAAVAANGSFSLPGADAGNYNVEITTATATVGATAPAVTLPAGWVSTGEHFGTGSGSDGTVNGILPLGNVSSDTANSNFGIDQLPSAATTSGTFVNPGGTATIQVPTLTGSDPEQGAFPGTGNADTVIINTLPASGILYYNGTPVVAGDTIKNYNPALLTFDPVNGSGSYTITFSEVDAAGNSSSPATVTINITSIAISGSVFDDANGLSDNTVNGTGTNAGGLNAVLVDAGTGKVIAAAAVAANGSFSLPGADAGNYNVEITTASATVGATAPAVTLPAGWVSTGEHFGTGSGSDGTVNGILPLGNVSSDTANSNFGIDQLPSAATTSGTFVNPGGTATIQVPTLTGSDPEQGAFPGTGNADTVIINTLPASGILYYNGTPVVAGDTIKNYNPALLTFDPVNGSGSYTITFSEVDAAGNSSSPATVTINITSIAISGSVFDDANGLSDNTVNGTGTNAGGLNAVLVDAGTGKVIAAAAVAANGSFSLPGADAGNYNVEITTATATVGATAPAVTLPAGWVSTGEHFGTGSGSDGTVNGILPLGNVSSDTANSNFGIDQLPAAATTSGTFVNPGGTATIQVPTLTGSDPEQGAFPGTGNADTVIINTLPASGILYYNGTPVVAGDTIKNYNPALLTFDPVNGSGSYTITFSEVDAAGNSSSPATVTINITSIAISGSVFDDANGLSDNTVNGTGTNAGGLNAVLVDAGTGKVIAAAAVAANGSFSLPGADAGNYNVEITTATATVGATAPAVTLPAGWVSTGEHFGTGSGSDGTVNGILPLGNVSSDTANSNFGIDQLPSAATTSGTFVNPGGTATIQVPTLTGSDPEQGAFPGTGNADTVIINTLPASGILYYNGTPVVAGDTIKNYNPALLTFDPVNGSGSYTITFSEVDAAGNSSSPATVTINITSIAISGSVFDDANGLSDNTVNGTGTNAGGLNAVLVDAGTGKVIAAAAVAANGSFSLPGADAGNYNVEITTASATVGATAPAVTLPAGWVSTGEHFGTGSGSDGTVNGILPLGNVSSDTANSNFGIDQLPAAATTSGTFVNPGGTATIQVPTLTGSDPEQGAFPGTGNADTVIINTLPASGILYYNGTPVVAGDTIKNYNPALLTFDPVNGSGSYTITFSEVDAAGNSSSPATVTINITSIAISGSVFDDANGLSDNTVNGTGTNAGGLNAVLVDAGTGKVIAAAAVAANGSFSLPGADAGNYNVEITTASATVGATAPAVTLPAGWVSTGEHFGTGSGSDGTVNGILPLGNVSSDTANSNFGIDQLPAAATTSGTFVNPGGTATIQVPTLTGSDPEQGAFPGTGNADTVIINTLPASGILYYNGTPVVAGDTIKNYNPALLTFDPVNGSGSYTITFSEVDAAGNSSSPATVTINITSIAISGSVFDDANGLSDNTVNGTGTNAGGLNAVLVDAGTGKVIAAAAVAANGSFSLPGADAGNYNVEITTASATVGATAPAVTLPAGWVSTGEHFGTGSGSDGTVNGILPLGNVSSDTANSNFGIDQLPVSSNQMYSIPTPAINSILTLSGTGAAPGPLSGSDPEDGVLGATNTIVITNLPTNAELYYNGILLTSDTTINNYDTSLLQIKFITLGSVSSTFQYTFLDSAGNQSATPATYTILWSNPLPIVLISFNAIKVNNTSLLKWSTASELNTSKFIIERSIDKGTTWQAIGYLDAAHNSRTTQNYSYTDANPANGINLYRLKTIDYNNSFRLSDVKQIEIDNNPSITIYPNPAKFSDAIHLKLAALQPGKYQLNIVSASGQLLYANTISITNGLAINYSIPITVLSQGINTIVIEGKDLHSSNKILIINK